MISGLKKVGPNLRDITLIGIGILVGFTILLGGKAGIDATSSDKFCDQACHAHPEATQTWIKSTHFTTKSGVVTHCIECHPPPRGSGITPKRPA